MAAGDRRERFVQEYLVDLNATQAAIRAGYSERTANEQGARLLAIASVQTAIQALKDKRAERTQITADEVVQELRRIGFAPLAESEFRDNVQLLRVKQGALSRLLDHLAPKKVEMEHSLAGIPFAELVRLSKLGGGDD